MARKRTTPIQAVASSTTVLLVGSPSPALDRKHRLLETSGFDITRAENICYAEVFAETHYFDAAICDESLPAPEQQSLARVMRVRWPWMRLISCGVHSAADKTAADEIAADETEDRLFDARETSESALPETLRGILS